MANFSALIFTAPITVTKANWLSGDSLIKISLNKNVDFVVSAYIGNKIALIKRQS
jgi:hypothetical protein